MMHILLTSSTGVTADNDPAEAQQRLGILPFYTCEMITFLAMVYLTSDRSLRASDPVADRTAFRHPFNFTTFSWSSKGKPFRISHVPNSFRRFDLRAFGGHENHSQLSIHQHNQMRTEHGPGCYHRLCGPSTRASEHIHETQLATLTLYQQGVQVGQQRQRAGKACPSTTLAFCSCQLYRNLQGEAETRPAITGAWQRQASQSTRVASTSSQRMWTVRPVSAR